MTGDNGPQTTVLEPEILTPDQVPVPSVTSALEIETLAERFALEAQTDLRMAQAVQVTDDATYEQAGQLRVAIDKKRKGGEGVVELVCAPLYTKWRAFRGLLMAPVDTRAQALKVLSDKRLAYERQKQAEADRLRKIQEEEARKEQARLDKLALERAARAEARGDSEKAEEILATVPQIPLPVAQVGPVVEKTKGVAKVVYWRAQVLDLKALVTAVAAGEVPMDAILANEPWLHKTAAALKANLRYPGVRAVSEEREKSTGR